jgi:hypothetical protein
MFFSIGDWKLTAKSRSRIWFATVIPVRASMVTDRLYSFDKEKRAFVMPTILPIEAIQNSTEILWCAVSMFMVVVTWFLNLR